MGEWPDYALPCSPILTPFSPESLGNDLNGISSGSVAGCASSTLTQNKAIIIPFRLTTFETAYQLLWYVGATSNGNIDIGIYDSQKNRIVSAGGVAMSATTNTVQEINITDTVLPPGEYMLAAVTDSATGTIFAFNPPTADELVLSLIGLYEQATAYTLPDPLVPVLSTVSVGVIPLVGIQLRSVF